MPALGRACGSCEFYDTEKPGDEDGLCRRNPPVAIVTEDADITAFPVVLPDGWCGEYRPVMQ